MDFKENFSEILIAALLIVFAGLFINPYWMPRGLVSTLLIVFTGLFISFVIFIWREKRGDERENYLRNIAGRIGYLMSALVLVIGIIYEILAHQMVNKWLITALIVMIVAKTLGFMWAKRTY